MLFGLLGGPSAHAAESGAALDWSALGMGLVGGLALFLFGMEAVSQGLRVIAGERVKEILARLSNNRLMGLLTGAILTAVLQSSSITTVLLVSFVSAGLMSLGQSLGVILGANIGTTITAQIIAFKVTRLAMVLVAAGVFLELGVKQDSGKQVGRSLMGLGLIFWGMSLMSDTMRPLRDFPPFVDLMAEMANPMLGMLSAALFTALVQSSSATMGIVIALASQGLISLEAGIALILGANVGTCITAGLASIGQPPEARQVALAHTFYNLSWSVLLVPFIPGMAWLVKEITPANMSSAEALAVTLPRQLANAHTLFNVGMAVAFIGFTGPLARWIRGWIPSSPPEEPRLGLDRNLLAAPALALEVVRRRMLELGFLVEEIYLQVPQAVFLAQTNQLRTLEARDAEVDTLHASILQDISTLSQVHLSDSQTDELLQLANAVNELESIGDLVENVFTMLGLERIQHGLDLSGEAQLRAEQAHTFTLEVLREALQAVATQDAQMAQKILELKRSGKQKISRVVHGDPHQSTSRMLVFRLESELAEGFRRVFYHTRRLVKPVARPPTSVASDPSTPL